VARSGLVILAAVAVAASVSACTSETPGVADGNKTSTGSTPTGGPFTGSNSPGSPTSGVKPTTAGPLAGKSPCSILTPADVSGFQLGSGKEENRTISRSCEYLRSGQYVMTVVIYDSRGIQDVQERGQLKSLTVGGREANQGLSSGGVCSIAIKTGEKSRVDASVSATSGDEKKACDLAGPLAEAVAKNLP